MSNTRTALIKKILTNRFPILTPFEAVHLKYLVRKEMLEELINAERHANPYMYAQEATGGISPHYVDLLVRRTASDEPELFKSYFRAYENIFYDDSNNEKLGYKGLTLLTQLRLIRCERSSQILLGKLHALDNFTSYSNLHQKPVTYLEVLGTLVNTFRYFVFSIDSILTLNFYLKEMIDLDDLSSLNHLKMWLKDEVTHLNDEKSKKLSNEAHLCCDPKNIQQLLNENHQNYVDGLRRRYTNIPSAFAEDSLIYVKNVLSETVGKKLK